MRLLMFTFILLFFFTSLQSLSQPISELLKNSVILNSIDPEDENFSDLSALKKKLSNATVVVLGEISHNDGLSFKAKSRLVKYLHKELGFDVLAWEAGFIGAWQINEDLKSKMALYSAKSNLMSGGWVNSEFTKSLWEYIEQTQKTSRPLLMAGFDSERPPKSIKTIQLQISDILEITHLKEALESKTKILDSAVMAFAGYLGNNVYKNFSQKGKQEARQILNMLFDTLQNIVKISPPSSNLHSKPYSLFLRSFLMDMEMNEVLYSASPQAWNLIRDNNMARRFAWIRENLYPGKKIIIWAASGHLINNSHLLIPINGKLSEYEYPFTIHMGHYLKRQLKDSMYTIFCTTYGGEEGNVYPENKKRSTFRSIIAEPNKSSYEAIAHQLGKPFFITDLRSAGGNSWLKKKFIARPLGYTENLAEWHSIIDAFLYIDKMEPDKQN